MTLLRFFAVIALSSFSLSGFACSPPPSKSAAEIAAGAPQILVGYVVAAGYPEMEKHLLDGGAPFEIRFPSRYQARVVFTRVLRGTKARDALVSTPCDMPLDLGTRVIIARFAKYDYVVTRDQEQPLATLLKVHLGAF